MIGMAMEGGKGKGFDGTEMSHSFFKSNVSRIAPCKEAIIAEPAAGPARLWRKYQQ